MFFPLFFGHHTYYHGIGIGLDAFKPFGGQSYLHLQYSLIKDGNHFLKVQHCSISPNNQERKKSGRLFFKKKTMSNISFAYF